MSKMAIENIFKKTVKKNVTPFSRIVWLNQHFQFESPEDVQWPHSYQNRNEITIFEQRTNDSPQRIGDISTH